MKAPSLGKAFSNLHPDNPQRFGESAKRWELVRRNCHLRHDLETLERLASEWKSDDPELCDIAREAWTLAEHLCNHVAVGLWVPRFRYLDGFYGADVPDSTTNARPGKVNPLHLPWSRLPGVAKAKMSDWPGTSHDDWEKLLKMDPSRGCWESLAWLAPYETQFFKSWRLADTLARASGLGENAGEDFTFPYEEHGKQAWARATPLRPFQATGKEKAMSAEFDDLREHYRVFCFPTSSVWSSLTAKQIRAVFSQWASQMIEELGSKRPDPLGSADEWETLLAIEQSPCSEANDEEAVKWFVQTRYVEPALRQLQEQCASTTDSARRRNQLFEADKQGVIDTERASHTSHVKSRLAKMRKLVDSSYRRFVPPEAQPGQ